MNNPSPFNPQSSSVEQKNQSRTRVRTAVTLVFAVNFIALMALLIIGFGCRKPAEPEVPAPDTNAMAMPGFDTNTAALPGTNNPPATTNTYVPPIPDTAVNTVPPALGQEYVIVKGDTFEKIAKAHGLSTKAIEDANPGVDPKKLKINQKIQIPAAATTSATSSNPPMVADNSGEQIYKVLSGDTLTTIAKHFGVSVRSLRSANSLTTDKIKVGDKLKIPAKSAPASTPVSDTAPASSPKPM